MQYFSSTVSTEGILARCSSRRPVAERRGQVKRQVADCGVAGLRVRIWKEDASGEHTGTPFGVAERLSERL